MAKVYSYNCPNCGLTVDKGWEVCGSCGAIKQDLDDEKRLLDLEIQELENELFNSPTGSPKVASDLDKFNKIKYRLDTYMPVTRQDVEFFNAHKPADEPKRIYDHSYTTGVKPIYKFGRK